MIKFLRQLWALQVLALLSCLASASDRINVCFVCSGADSNVSISGQVFGPIVQNFYDPPSSVAKILVSGPNGSIQIISMTGYLLGPDKWRDPQTGTWHTRPMRTYLEGLATGQKVGIGAQFDQTINSLLNFGNNSVKVYCASPIFQQSCQQ